MSKILKISTNTNLGGQSLPYIYDQILMFCLKNADLGFKILISFDLNTNFGQVRLAALHHVCCNLHYNNPPIPQTSVHL
jgi:hypothetical protein